MLTGMFDKHYTVTIVIKADDSDEAMMMAETMASGTSQGAVIQCLEASQTEAWAYDRLLEEQNR